MNNSTYQNESIGISLQNNEEVLIQSFGKNTLLLVLFIFLSLLATFALLFLLMIITQTDPENSPALFILLLTPFFCFLVYRSVKSPSLIAELTVTNKRVYGTIGKGMRVDLPMDYISATKRSLFNTVTITTASGSISFRGIDNADEVLRILSEQFIIRQAKPSSPVVKKAESSLSKVAEIKEYKELLDNNIITQEEFDAKKKQLLGL